jgi:hypothetical protein
MLFADAHARGVNTVTCSKRGSRAHFRSTTSSPHSMAAQHGGTAWRHNGVGQPGTIVHTLQQVQGTECRGTGPTVGQGHTSISSPPRSIGSAFPVGRFRIGWQDCDRTNDDLGAEHQRSVVRRRSRRADRGRTIPLTIALLTCVPLLRSAGPNRKSRLILTLLALIPQVRR